MFVIVKPGLQTTLQGALRMGHRHLGIPYSGPADSLSMALANRLVENPIEATSLEITYGGFEAEIEQACTIAITGAGDEVLISGRAAPLHMTLHVSAGDRVEIAPMQHGARAYLAIHSGFRARVQFGATSTYLPAGLGGHDGRALRVGDDLSPNAAPLIQSEWQTPRSLRPFFDGNFALRATPSAETDLLSGAAREILFNSTFTVGRQATRMGLSLEGHKLVPESDGRMASAPVFPGTIQCPPSGTPIALLSDAQTTGGYPRIASIARCDRHLLGQARPGDGIRLLHRGPAEAALDFQRKQALINNW
ncbi:MAG: biotin-dependent carboxyltransferase family protein, partial [Pseudomonadota bacterium]